MKNFLLIILIGTGAVSAYMAYDSIRQKPLARVDTGPQIVRITNGNDQYWQNVTIILNEAFDGPLLQVPGAWPAGEKREFQLREFQRRFNNQPFNPEFERVRQVLIDVPGFQLGTYR